MNEAIGEDELKWIGVDFDKTLCGSSGYPDYKILDPLPGAVEAMRELWSRGWKLTIFTARSWADYRDIESWCEKWEIPTRRIICGKPLFRYMIDDKNIEFGGDWSKVLKKIK